MKASDIPPKFPEAFAAFAAAGFIRPIPTTTGDPAAASLDLGFPPATATPVGAGGTPPSIEDINGILNQITLWSQWQAAAGPIKRDGTFQTAIGGYTAGTVLASASVIGNFWISTVDDNTTNPDASGAGWTGFTFLGLAPLASPTFTGSPRAPTATFGNSSTLLSNTAFVATAIAALSSALTTAYTAAINAAIASLPVTLGYVSAPTAFTYGGAVGPFTHLLGDIPSIVTLDLINISNDAAYNPGDVVDCPFYAAYSGEDRGARILKSTTQISLRFGAQAIIQPNASTGAATSLTASKWNVVVRAFT